MRCHIVTVSSRKVSSNQPLKVQLTTSWNWLNRNRLHRHVQHRPPIVPDKTHWSPNWMRKMVKSSITEPMAYWMDMWMARSLSTQMLNRVMCNCVRSCYTINICAWGMWTTEIGREHWFEPDKYDRMNTVLCIQCLCFWCQFDVYTGKMHFYMNVAKRSILYNYINVNRIYRDYSNIITITIYYICFMCTLRWNNNRRQPDKCGSCVRCAVCVWVSGWRGVTACGFELHQCTTWNTHTLHKPQTQTCPNKIIHYKLISQHKFHTNIAVFFWFGLYELTGWMSIRRHKCCCQIQNSNKHFMHNVIFT